ncbi:P-loop containing nucleoside triphosphate hydrolase protein [Syncephalastrum racemosum]|uniref:P-loop containing nucleoside triphosphate hydrolase protein n=1 Tax=Syncephalastrum racemosum TaxID=13706 RepID=A0A1X2GZJ2_SYNRA|nr:P-loop containing nucleoside triphosphate hydrolase protein [Syncephalastrum racemosum]
MIEPTLGREEFSTTPNVFHQALLYLVSQRVQNQSQGSYMLKPNYEADREALEPPDFHMVPQPNEVHTVDQDGHEFHIQLVRPNVPLAAGERSQSNEPLIRVAVKRTEATVATLVDFLNQTARNYLKHAESLRKQTRSRYDYAASGKWVRICSLYEVQGLQTVALCPENEQLIENDLEAFIHNKGFYKRIGAPYVRGYLLHGSPGTGKTSLVFAIASVLKRHLYFINLSYIDSDSELFQAFASVPANSIVVFEDVDTMTPILHARRAMSLDASPRRTRDDDSAGPRFNLSTFLSILDGHTLEEGIIFIMTTNHPEVLDPAIKRPGRMDIDLELTYATHYQMRRMYRMVLDDDDTSTLDAIYPDLEQEIPEFVVPPSEIMQIMVLYRRRVEEIPDKLRRLVHKYTQQQEGAGLLVETDSPPL